MKTPPPADHGLAGLQDPPQYQAQHDTRLLFARIVDEEARCAQVWLPLCVGGTHGQPETTAPRRTTCVLARLTGYPQ
jgi:hypothetical protein